MIVKTEYIVQKFIFRKTKKQIIFKYLCTNFVTKTDKMMCFL